MHINEKYDLLRAMALGLILSDEVKGLEGPKASVIFELVGDMTIDEADSIIAKFGVKAPQ